jgi:predicted nuclease of restriction endonuclease-like RecB superfamily
MRSRLEAQFAAQYADFLGSRGWEYEPCAFADERGDYLPDFKLLSLDGVTYVEIRRIRLPMLR